MHDQRGRASVRSSFSRLAIRATLCGIAFLMTGPTRAQPARWTQIPVAGPSARYGHAMAYDEHRRITTVFGGNNLGVFNAETWEWDDAAWTQRQVSGPSAREGSVMAYDTQRQVMVLFGGRHNQLYSAETWEWDGTTWTERQVPGPSARALSAMSYDGQRGVAVLFGGYHADGSIDGETWEWDGTTWNQRVIGGGPSPRYYPAMCYDGSRNVTVLFGGCCTFADTWEWDGTAWTQRSGGLGRAGHGAVFDHHRDVIVIFGGNFAVGDTWEWSDGQYTSQPVIGPPGRYLVGMVFDAARHGALMFGGYSNAPQTIFADTWMYTCAPVLTAHPVPDAVCPSGSATLNVTVVSDLPATFQWQRETAPNSNTFADLTDGATGAWDGGSPGVGAIISGSSTATLMIAADIANGRNLSSAHAIRYRCNVLNTCGSVDSAAAQVSVGDLAGDVDCNCTVDLSDLSTLLARFGTASGASRADGDLDGDADVDLSDLATLLGSFGSICP